MPDFHVVSSYVPSGDQPEAIDALASGLERGIAEQTLLGVRRSVLLRRGAALLVSGSSAAVLAF